MAQQRMKQRRETDMKVSLIDCTGMRTTDPSGYAASILIFTKSTRLEMKPELLMEIQQWPWPKKEEELRYMANTIPSSWEFCHYTFMIQDVTRAFTHQLVRTRTASFAQQTMRVLNVEGWKYGTGPTIEGDHSNSSVYKSAMMDVAKVYNDLIEHGAAIEDARGILPTNIHTNIVMGANLRVLAEMIRKRSSPRVQGEYRDFISLLKSKVIEVHPWAEIFFNQDLDKAAEDLCKLLIDATGLRTNERVAMVKLVDQMKSA
jgi:flavin-dependent thymidylate synthase